MEKNIPFHKSLKFKINKFITILFILIIVFLISNSNKQIKELISTKEEDLNQVAIDTIDRRFEVSYQILEVGSSQLIANPLIVDAVEREDKDKLLELISDSYKELKKAGIVAFHFYESDGSPLFSFNKVQETNLEPPCGKSLAARLNSESNLKPIRGIDEYKSGFLFLRHISPIYDENNQYIGSLELGMEVGERMLNIFQDVSGGDWYLYSLKDEGKSLLKSTTDKESINLDLDDKSLASIKSGEILSFEKSPYIVQIIPIKNYDGEYVNYLKRVYDNSQLISLQKEYMMIYVIYGIFAGIFAIALHWSLLTYLLNPLTYLEKEVRKLESGILNKPIKIKSSDELGYLAGAMESMRRSLNKRQLELREQSYIDPLTGVYNRLYFKEFLDDIKSKKSCPTAFIFADIDELKDINDNLGHKAGDDYIVESINVIKNAMRDNDKIFRIGGDEFMLIFPDTDRKAMDLILERIKLGIKDHNNQLEKNQIKVSISFGTSIYQNESDCLKSTIALADEDMYRNKRKKTSN